MRNSIILLVFGLLFAACGGTTLTVLDIDQIQPSKIIYPESLRRIGVVDRIHLQPKDEPANPFAPDSKQYCDEMAQSLADANYFDGVVVCDSDVSNLNRKEEYIYPLEQAHVEQLTNDLEVDALLTLESVMNQLIKLSDSTPAVQVRAVARLYLPGRKQPIQTFSQVDTLSWSAVYLPTLADMRTDIRNFTTDKMAHQLVPYWKSVERFYYDGGSVDMRDAAFFVRKGDWNKAKELWTNALTKAKGKTAVQLRLNLIVADEMLGNVTKALNDCTQLEQSCAAYPNEYKLVVYYLSVLKQRNEDMGRLKLQMHRFE